MSSDNKPRYPIGIVAARTGLTPDVLRVWERRYAVVKPVRTAGGQRTYSGSDIERLTLLRRATQAGHGISHLASLGAPSLEELVREVDSSSGGVAEAFHLADGPQAAVEEAISFTETLDPAGLEVLLRRSFARYGIVTFLDAIVGPFLMAVGDGWRAGTLTVAQEHLATALVQRVVSQTAPIPTGADGSPTIVLATLEGERHATGALMAAAIAASAGWHAIHLGADVPTGDIAGAALQTRARAVGVSVVRGEKKKRFAARLRDLEKSLPRGVTLLVGGGGAQGLREALGKTSIAFIDSMLDLHGELNRIRSRSPHREGWTPAGRPLLKPQAAAV